MTNNSTKKTNLTEQQKQTLADISRQIEMALGSDKTPQGVKDCLETIIMEASNEAGMMLTDFSLVRAAFPNIIENLNEDYGRGVYHSIHAILQFNTDAFKDFYEQRLDEENEADSLYSKLAGADTETLAVAVSAMMHNPLLPAHLYNVIGDEIATVGDIHSPANVLYNLNKLNESGGRNES